MRLITIPRQLTMGLVPALLSLALGPENQWLQASYQLSVAQIDGSARRGQ